MKITKSFLRIALAAGLIGLAACGGSDSSSRNRNTTLEDGSICYTDVERAGLIEIAVPREQQDAVEYRAAIPAQAEVVGQPEVKAQAGVSALIAPFFIPEVADQPEVPFQAAVPDQEAVPARGHYWLHLGQFEWDDGTVRWMANRGSWTWVNERLVRTQVPSDMVYYDATPARPAVKGTPEVKFQEAVPGHRAYKKGEEITEAIPEIVGQPEIKAQPAVDAQPEIPAREEIKGATKEEVIQEINDVPSCPETTVPSAEIPHPTFDLSYSTLEGDQRRASLKWIPDAADKEVYFALVTQKGFDVVEGESKAGEGVMTSNTLNPGCEDRGTFEVIRKSDNQLMAIIDFNHPDQDISKCEIVAPEPTVPNETTTTEAPATAVETTEAPAVTVAPVVEETAKAAIVTSTATEVQLPPAAVEVTVKVEDVYTGFGVTASDVKSIEYQIDAGSWTAVTPGAALKIPNAASKMAIRVTKTNGEEVVSEKAIVRTEESTDTTVAESDTTMAPADTTASETTDAPESSDSSSSNNTLLYILGFVIVAGAAGFFFKKKSTSTK
jgi:LPXTG-motif cell wall-anchored protein